ncbi:acyltransferase [Nocardioides sp.]|uniref:acyltransferase n=1 Tax=Nocardioides sp. TaxID=35761 RepID=UPI002633383B|nr:acyltransferase [Nocardioides sp.]
MYEQFGTTFEDDLGNRIEIGGELTEQALANLKRVVVSQWTGRGNHLVLTSLDFHMSDVMRVYMTYGSYVEVGKLLLMADMRIYAGDRAHVVIGDDGMFASDVEVLASNVHTVFDLDGTPNKDKKTEIGPHVWLGKGSRIIAGSTIGRGSVIGGFSVVAGRIPNNCVAAGNPCRVVKRNIFWGRRRARPVANYHELPTDFQDVPAEYIGATIDDSQPQRRRWGRGFRR